MFIAILKVLSFLLIICLFIYSKLQNYEAHLAPNFKNSFGRIKGGMKPILGFLGRFIKPYKLGASISIDAAQLVLLVLLLIILAL
jgi:hypothetical protein